MDQESEIDVVCEPVCEKALDSAPEKGTGLHPSDNSRNSSSEKQPHPSDSKRWADGTWRTGDEAALTHGVRRYELRGVLPDHVRQLVDAFNGQLVADRGGAAEMGAVESGYVRRLTQLEGSLELLGEDLVTRGVMTERGRPRAAFMLFLRTLDTWDRYAQRLGTQRRQKRLPTLQDWAAEHTSRSEQA